MSSIRFQRMSATNGDAAQIILSNPARYDGLPLVWAKLWVKNHGAPPESCNPSVGVLQRSSAVLFFGDASATVPHQKLNGRRSRYLRRPDPLCTEVESPCGYPHTITPPH